MTAIFPSPFPGAIATYSRPNSNGETKGFFCTKCGARLMHQSISRDSTPAAAVSVKSGCLDGVKREMIRLLFTFGRSRLLSIFRMVSRRIKADRLGVALAIVDLQRITNEGRPRDEEKKSHSIMIYLCLHSHAYNFAFSSKNCRFTGVTALPVSK